MFGKYIVGKHKGHEIRENLREYSSLKELALDQFFKNLSNQNVSDLNAQNMQGKTALHCVVEAYFSSDNKEAKEKYAEVIVQLINTPGIDLTIKDSKELTALDLVYKYYSKREAKEDGFVKNNLYFYWQEKLEKKIREKCKLIGLAEDTSLLIFHYAIKDNNFSKVRDLIDNGYVTNESLNTIYKSSGQSAIDILRDLTLNHKPKMHNFIAYYMKNKNEQLDLNENKVLDDLMLHANYQELSQYIKFEEFNIFEEQLGRSIYKGNKKLLNALLYPAIEKRDLAAIDLLVNLGAEVGIIKEEMENIKKTFENNMFIKYLINKYIYPDYLSEIKNVEEKIIGEVDGFDKAKQDIVSSDFIPLPDYMEPELPDYLKVKESVIDEIIQPGEEEKGEVDEVEILQAGDEEKVELSENEFYQPGDEEEKFIQPINFAGSIENKVLDKVEDVYSKPEDINKLFSQIEKIKDKNVEEEVEAKKNNGPIVL